MKISIMQPYYFPYIGYFQLIYCVDKFIFYDDVNYINKGWINRNRILINDKTSYITIQLSDASQNKLIKDIYFIDNREKISKSIMMAYKKAPFFNKIWPIVESIHRYPAKTINELAIFSITQISNYLMLNTIFEQSSILYSESRGLEKAERLKKICKANNSSEYINPIGGMELYSKEDFKTSEIELKFLKTKEISYNQFSAEFVPWLSIIDVLMFNSKEETHKMLNMYVLV